MSSMDGSSDPPPAETCCSASQPTKDDACASGGCARPGDNTAQASCCNAADTPPPQPATNDACARQGDDAAQTCCKADTAPPPPRPVRRRRARIDDRSPRRLVKTLYSRAPSNEHYQRTTPSRFPKTIWRCREANAKCVSPAVPEGLQYTPMRSRTLSGSSRNVNELSCWRMSRTGRVASTT